MKTNSPSSHSRSGPADGPLLRVRNLSTSFHLLEGVVPAISGVNLDLYPGEILGIAGESGCGKSITAKSILRIIPCPPGDIHCGEVLLEGTDLLQLSEREMQRVREERSP